MVERFKMQFYAIEKKSKKLFYQSASLFQIKESIKNNDRKESEFIITKDIDMKYISRIVYVDGECVYNNKDFWINTATSILEDFTEHEVLDFMGIPVNKFRFETEYNSNTSRISEIDGLAGEIDYNMTVGNEFIALFREECVKTDFKGITPLEIGVKLAPVISLVQTGSFREAKQVLQSMETDPFLTEERMAKYIAMMDAADAIEYATPEEFFYTAEVQE